MGREGGEGEGREERGVEGRGEETILKRTQACTQGTHEQ